MPYVGLLLVIALLAVAVFLRANKDWFSPAFVTCVVYGFSVLMAIVGFASWNQDTGLSSETILIILFGLIGVILGGECGRLLIKKRNKKSTLEFRKINLPKWVCVVGIVLVAVTVVLTFFEIRRICLYYGHDFTNLPDMLAFYRTKTLLFENAAANNGVTINTVVSQLQKICYFLCVFNAYFLFESFKSFGIKEDWFRRASYIVVVALVLVLSILTTSRSMFMHFIVAFVVLAVFEFLIWKRFNKRKAMKWFGGIAIAALVAFYALTPIVGRQNNMSAGEYITFYLGSPVPSLNEAIEREDTRSKEFGEKTFYGVYYSLARLHIIDSYPEQNRIGVVFDGYGGSNMYTSFSFYYLDFGMVGVIVLSIIFGFVIEVIYEFVRRNYGNVFIVVLYAYYYYVMIDQIRGDLFYSLISISTLTYVLFAYVIYKFYLITGKNNEK